MSCEHKNISPIKWEGRDFHVYCPGCDKTLIFKNCSVVVHDRVRCEEVETQSWTFTAQPLIECNEDNKNT